MKRTTISLLFALASQHALGAIEPGDYIFLYGQLVDCGDRVYVVDYAEVPANGEVEFFEGFEVAVGDLSEDEIVSHLVRAITEQTGHTPKTLSARVVSADDEKLIATEMMKLALGPPTCPRRKEPTAPAPDIEYIQTLARGLPSAAEQGAGPGVSGQMPGWS